MGKVVVLKNSKQRFVFLENGSYLCEELKNTAMERKEEAKKAPKEMSKAGMFLQKHPNGIGEIIDMRAVLK